MIQRLRHLLLTVLGLALLAGPGCDGVTIELPGGTIALPGLGVVTLRLVNDTDFPIDPHIVYDDDNSALAALFPSEELGVHDLAPGEVATLSIDCDKLGVVRSAEAEQFAGPFTYTAPDSTTLERDEDYECGALIEFRYLGHGDAFDVIVAINGVVVD